MAEQRDEAASETREENFRALFGEHYGSIVAYALRRCESADDAHDVAAEVFVAAWRRFDDLPSQSELRPWLYGVARRCLSTQRRGRLRRARLVGRLVERDRTCGDVDGGEIQDDRVDVVRSALATLRLADREILQLATWEELSHRHIAVALGVTENAVAIRLHRARERLRRAMEE